MVPYEGDRTYFALKSQDTAGGWSVLSNNSFWPPLRVYLPLILKAFSTPAPTPTLTPTTQPPPGSLIRPADLIYLGAFRLPGGDVRPETFAYGGNAMTFNPSGDPSGPNDGFLGSLFVTGHDRLAYGELPDGSQVAEVSIPVPVESDSLDELNQAEFLQGFHNVAEGYFTELEEIPHLPARVGQVGTRQVGEQRSCSSIMPLK